VVILTIYQVLAPSSMLGLDLQPDKKLTDNIALNLAIRLFAWVLTGALVYMLMYSPKTPGRSDSTRKTGLIASVVNIILWAVITAWYFMNIHGQSMAG